MNAQQFTSTMTSKGQVTIPAAVRRILKLEPNSAVTFEVEGAEVRIKPARHAPDAIYEVSKPLPISEVFERGTHAYQTMLASEDVLRRDWDSPEEDAAWANL